MRRRINKPILSIQERETGTNALQKGLDAGYIFLDGTEYCGRASDGVVVRLGNCFNNSPDDALLRYLSKFPEPNQW